MAQRRMQTYDSGSASASTDLLTHRNLSPVGIVRTTVSRRADDGLVHDSCSRKSCSSTRTVLVHDASFTAAKRKDTESPRRSEKGGLSEQLFVTTCEPFCASSGECLFASPFHTSISRCCQREWPQGVFVRPGRSALPRRTDGADLERRNTSMAQELRIWWKSCVGEPTHDTWTWTHPAQESKEVRIAKVKGRVYLSRSYCACFAAHCIQRPGLELVTHSCFATFGASRYDKHAETSEFLVATC